MGIFEQKPLFQHDLPIIKDDDLWDQLDLRNLFNGFRKYDMTASGMLWTPKTIEYRYATVRGGYPLREEKREYPITDKDGILNLVLEMAKGKTTTFYIEEFVTSSPQVIRSYSYIVKVELEYTRIEWKSNQTGKRNAKMIYNDDIYYWEDDFTGLNLKMPRGYSYMGMKNTSECILKCNQDETFYINTRTWIVF